MCVGDLRCYVEQDDPKKKKKANNTSRMGDEEHEANTKLIFTILTRQGLQNTPDTESVVAACGQVGMVLHGRWQVAYLLMKYLRYVPFSCILQYYSF